jgi:hypothetical protein
MERKSKLLPRQKLVQMKILQTVYNRFEYLNERRAAIEAWANHIADQSYRVRQGADT